MDFTEIEETEGAGPVADAVEPSEENLPENIGR